REVSLFGLGPRIPATKDTRGVAGRARALPSFCAQRGTLSIVLLSFATMLRLPPVGRRPGTPVTDDPMAHGIHLFMNPGPTNIPDRILRAMDRGTIDFTGARFKAIADECFAGLQRVFKTENRILGYAATGHGAWEAALVNLFSPGDKVLV